MNIQGKEIIAADGMYIYRKTDTEKQVPMTRAILLPNETIDSFEEVAQSSIPTDELRAAIEAKTAEITAYDTSSEVNLFYLYGTPCWLDRDTRVSLMNSTTITKNAGMDTTTLWLNGHSLTIPCDTAIELLGQLELYALQCYNKTAEHKANVAKLTTVEEVQAYDYTVGYPEKLKLNP